MYFEEEQAMKKLFGWMQSKRQARAEIPAAEKKEPPAKVETSTLPEPVDEQKANAGEVVAMGWGTEPGEVAEVGAKARTQFHEPPTDRRGFPHFPTFCKGYGKGCGACRFFRMGRGPFCAVWGAAWPDFQREEKPARCGYPIMPDGKDSQAGRERLKADVAKVRARLRRPPLEYPDGPDWFAFCEGYPEGCDGCRYCRPKVACWCRLWEACFPGVVRWYGWKEEGRG